MYHVKNVCLIAVISVKKSVNAKEKASAIATAAGESVRREAATKRCRAMVKPL